jgi:hypothetical protein
MLQLPSPEKGEGDNFLVAAVNQQGTTASGQLILPQESQAQALAFAEEIGLGAISKAGALPMGTEGEWLSFAEKKLINDESLDYQALLWELGSEIAEKKVIEQGGFNETYEKELLDNMQTWFTKGGGKLRYSKPSVSKENGFQLLAAEDLQEYDVVISAPLQLIMCKQTARNVVIQNRGKYLGEELQKTFEKNELWGMVIFVLHEYYKEVAGKGSKWGPFLRTLRMRYLTTPVIQSLKGTIAASMNNQWLKGSDSFMWWSVGADGPCSPTTGICKSKPLDRTGDSRFTIHQIRWAYWVVKQNAVKIKQISTGLEFIALVPFYNMVEKRLGAGGGITFDLDGTVSVHAGSNQEEGFPVTIHPGNMSDSEFFMRYLRIPLEMDPNPYTEIKLKLPGVVPKGSKFHYCLKGSQKEQNSDACKASYRSESMFWKSKVLTEWRQIMNLPPRMQELRMWATRLHLYGGQEEMALISGANSVLAGLPIPVDQMPAEEQLMYLGVARDNIEAALIAAGPQGDRPPPQLYTAPDPTEDWEADRAMQHLATFAVQAQNVIAAGNVILNATAVVLNQTRDFFMHGVLPMAGLDELDMFLLKKIGMLSHCGFENDMQIVPGNITEELFCAMRVHLMNESEIHVFCPKEARVWEDNCLNVEFMNYTAISYDNEMNVVNALRNSIHSLIASYPTNLEDDAKILDELKEGNNRYDYGPIMINAIHLRQREKEILYTALDFLDDHEKAVSNGTVVFQLEMKARERLAADLREAAHKKFLEEVKAKAALKRDLAVLEVNMGEGVPKVNLTLQEGDDIKQTIVNFMKKHGIQQTNYDRLHNALAPRVPTPPPLQLLMGVITPHADRQILGIPEGANATVETGIFCAKFDMDARDALSTRWCEALMERVTNRLTAMKFQRKILLVVPVSAPDTRKLQIIIHEGEQHDLMQFVKDFLEFYKMSEANAFGLAQEVQKRLPAIAMSIPIGLTAQRQVTIRFSLNENVTNVAEAFADYFQIDPAVKIEILKRARFGMAPGTFMV